jgi:hypothetical protein
LFQFQLYGRRNLIIRHNGRISPLQICLSGDRETSKALRYLECWMLVEENYMKRDHNRLRDLVPAAKRIPSYRVTSHDKRIAAAEYTRYFNFKRLGLSPSQPHSKSYGR